METDTVGNGEFGSKISVYGCIWILLNDKFGEGSKVLPREGLCLTREQVAVAKRESKALDEHVLSLKL